MANKPSQKDFFVGTYVGVTQVLIGMKVAGLYGPLAGFAVSGLIYVVCYKLYRATKYGKQ